MELVIATRNPGKIDELKALLAHLQVKILSLDDFPAIPEVAEEGKTYAENALAKAKAIHKATGKMALADDSGLEVDALKGEPGVHTARFGGEELSDHERYMRLLKMLENTPDEQRGATFRCTIAIVGPGKIHKVVEGACRGFITRAPLGGGGFGYDPVFVPSEYSQSFAELIPEVKIKISHRARALEKAALFLEGIVYSQMSE
ncbi:MAG: XTP/dITP diphosphatase [Candidatus Aureabacteria bacterium]|nr:XTP/dITP diphosphatase [Candidatus Auribacterota bacterium]